MTRFARADGSKGSNKKTYEEATPWHEMKNDLLKTLKKNKKKKTLKKKETNAFIKDNKEVLNKPFKTVITENKNQNLSHSFTLKEKTKEREKKFDDSQVDETSKKSKKNISLEEKKKNYIIEDGNKYFPCKDGTKKPWFDLPYKENDIMTRYKNFYIKREAIPELEAFQKSLEEKNLSPQQVS